MENNVYSDDQLEYVNRDLINSTELINYFIDNRNLETVYSDRLWQWNNELYDKLCLKYWSNKLWLKGYFIFMIRKVSEEIIKNYI